MSIKVECTWGDGPDIILTLKDHRYILYEKPDNKKNLLHGAVKNGSMDLNIEEAQTLANDLVYAINEVLELERSLKIYNERK